MGDIVALCAGILILIIAVMAGMIFSFLAGAKVYRAGRENWPVKVIEVRGREKDKKDEKDKKGEKEEDWDNG